MGSSDNNSLFYHANVDGFKTRVALITAELRLMSQKPQVVMLNETKTDKSDQMTIECYTLIFRKDRKQGGGGIAFF